MSIRRDTPRLNLREPTESTVDVTLRPLGCVGCLGSVLSLGLMPLVRRHHERQYPRELSSAGMRLRGGAFIPWAAFQRARRSDNHLLDRYLFTQFTFWHAQGRVTFPSHRLTDAAAVLRHIETHLPAGVEIEVGAPTILRGRRGPW
jgi:hypothetical protein